LLASRLGAIEGRVLKSLVWSLSFRKQDVAAFRIENTTQPPNIAITFRF